MANLLERAIDCDDGDDAAKVIRNALGIASDEVANYVFPKGDYVLDTYSKRSGR